MLNKRLSMTAAVLAAAVAAAGTAATASEISHFVLANGLEVVVIPDHRAPVATQMVWYKVGSADETPGKSGLGPPGNLAGNPKTASGTLFGIGVRNL